MGKGRLLIERSNGSFQEGLEFDVSELSNLAEGGFAFYTPVSYQGQIYGLKFFKGSRMHQKGYRDACRHADEEYDILDSLDGANGHAPRVYARCLYSREEGYDRAAFAAVLEEHVSLLTLAEAVLQLEPGAPLGRPHSARTAMVLGYAVAEACRNCANRRGIAIPHRDLNEQNIRFEISAGKAHCVLLDFGQATEADRETVTQTTQIRLAGLYVGAPETFDPANPARNLPSVDVWAMGALMFYIRTGRWPFQDPLHEVDKQSQNGLTGMGMMDVVRIKSQQADLLNELRTRSILQSRADEELASIIADCTNPKTAYDRVNNCRIETKGLANSLRLALRAYFPDAALSGSVKVDSSLSDEDKYDYAKAHFDRMDMLTFQYLQQLKQEGYKDAASLYDQLYAWHFETVANHGENDWSTNEASFEDNDTYYLHHRIWGGPPQGVVEVRTKTTRFSEDGSQMFLEEGSLGQWQDGRRRTVVMNGANLPQGRTWPRGRREVSYVDDQGNNLGSLSYEIVQRSASARLQYAKSHLNANDALTYDYLTQLKAEGNTEAAALFDQVFRAHVDFCVNYDPQDFSNHLNIIDDRYSYYTHYRVRGVRPGQVFHFTVTFSFSSDSGREDYYTVVEYGPCTNDSVWAELADASSSRGRKTWAHGLWQITIKDKSGVVIESKQFRIGRLNL